MRLRTPILALAAALLVAASPLARGGRAGEGAAGARRQSSQQRPSQPPPEQQQQQPTPSPSQQPAPPPQPQQQPPAPLLTPQPTPTQTPTQTPAQAPARAGEVDEDEVLSVETNLVNVLFNAQDRGGSYVTTIRREDVRVFENDVPQEITAFQHETNLPLSVAILIDVSNSLEYSLPDEKEAALRFINSVVRRGRDRVAVVSFSGTAVVEEDLTDDTEALRRAVDRVRIEPSPTRDEMAAYDAAERAATVPADMEEAGLRGSTALWDSVWATATEMMAQTPPSARRAVILLSDGDDSTSRVRREAAVEAAVRAGTTIYSIGFEPFRGDCDCKLEKDSLRKLSEQTGGRAFFPESAEEIGIAFGRIEHELRTQYLLSYAPTNRARDGSFRRIRVEVTNPELRKQKLKLTYREGYFALPPRPRSARPADAETQRRLKRPPRRPRRR